jgi:2-methylcitrate dehydratase PrpD
MTDTLTGRFIDHVLAVDYRKLPQELVELSRHIVLDGLAVTMAGATEPLGVGRVSIAYTRELGGAPDATVIAGGFKTSVLNAAFANGCMAHALDYDNTWYPLNHPTSPTLPAILAIAEKYSLPGSAVVEALVTAFEVQGRLRMAATGMTTGKGFHKPGITGLMGATAAVIKLLKLDRTQALMAMGIAGSRAGSISINTGTMTKSSHSGHAARMGVECGMLAKMGWTANADVFGPGGLFDTFWRGDAEPQRLVENFATPWRMIDPGVGFKKHPSNYFTHRPIDAALALRKDHALDPKRIASVRVLFPEFQYVNRPSPATGLDGKFSVQYATSVALLDGDVTIDSFTNERRFAPDMVSLLPRVTLEIDKSIPQDFNDTWAQVEVTLDDAKVLVRKVDRLTGWCGNPLTREQRLKKFYGCTTRVIARPDADRLVEMVDRLETLDDVHALMTIVRAGD